MVVARPSVQRGAVRHWASGRRGDAVSARRHARLASTRAPSVFETRHEDRVRDLCRIVFCSRVVRHSAARFPTYTYTHTYTHKHTHAHAHAHTKVCTLGTRSTRSIRLVHTTIAYRLCIAIAAQWSIRSFPDTRIHTV